MITFSIDDVEYNVRSPITIYSFCLLNNINLPCFCYHEKLSIAGNCRICIVEANNALAVACAMPIIKEMNIYTNNKRVKKAREGVLEFLLINHPLDCPICDQGGECDLQDISLVFGTDRGRFYESYKRSVDNLNTCGPFIKTMMTRCIHCTRCVRFLSEISGYTDFGVIGRGSFTEIGTFVQSHIFDEMSANIIDLCPVGALTSMPYAFVARPWELTSYESIDVMDTIASSIRIDVVNNKVVRILPCLKESRNEEWLHNRSRFIYDAFITQRNLYPRIKLFSNLIISNWYHSFYFILTFLNSYKFKFVEGVVGPFVDLLGAKGLKTFLNSIGCSNYNYQSNFKLTFDFRFSFLLNATISGLSDLTTCFFLGLNLRVESPILNSRLRKSFLKNESFLAFSIGHGVDYLTFPVLNLGNSVYDFLELVYGKHLFWAYFSTIELVPPFLFSKQSDTNKWGVFIGESVMSRIDGNSLFNQLLIFTERFFENGFCKNGFANSINLISNFLGRISSFEIGTLPSVNSSTFYLNSSLYSEKACFFYLCGVDNFDSWIVPDNSFIIYQGSFQGWDFIYEKVNVLLPVSIFTETISTYLNIEGAFVRTQKAITAPYKFVKSDSEVLKSLFLFKRFVLNDNFSKIESFYKLFSFFIILLNYTCIFFSLMSKHWMSKLKPVLIDDSKDFLMRLTLYVCKNMANNLKRVYNSIFSRTINDFYAYGDQFSINSKILMLSFSKIIISNFSSQRLLK